MAAPSLVLAIAGFDPTGGAGILADIKAIAANQGYGLACITALTVQNSQAARSYQAVDPKLLDQQLECLFEDFQPRAVKIGMLANRATVEVVARQLERRTIPWVVLDPVRAATSGAVLVDARGWEHMRERLFPLVSVLTPNLAEAEAITGMTLVKPAEMELAAAHLHSMGPRFVVVTGGHLERPVDVLYDGESCVALAADRVRTPHTHGTGCSFSSAIAANLANGKQVQDAVVMAKAYVTAALKQAYAIGAGPGPLNHLYRLQDAPASRNVDPAPMAEFTTR
ncbi:MAG: bifunctional hydroxymethylpyrimidine kinase/phosphomethylpyrimidine kinase [Terriglobales bacterium]